MTRELNFDGRANHNPNDHIEAFLDICDLFRARGANEDAIRLRVFPFSLTGEAKEWLRSLEPSSIDTWDQLRTAFLTRFYPPAREDRKRVELTCFRQRPAETLVDAWFRFKKLLRECPSHGMNKSAIVQTFYRGLDDLNREKVDFASGGLFMYKSPREAYQLLEDISIHRIGWSEDRNQRTVASVSGDTVDSDQLASVLASHKSLEKQIAQLSQSVHSLQVGCTHCGGSHLAADCENAPMTTTTTETANFLGNNFRDRPVGGNGWQPRPTFRDQRSDPPGFYRHNRETPPFPNPPRAELKSDMEELLKKFIQSTSTSIDTLTAMVESNRKCADDGMRSIEQIQRNQQASIQNLEKDLAKMADFVSNRMSGQLPPTTTTNPNAVPQRNEHAKAITTRSGLVTVDPVPSSSVSSGPQAAPERPVSHQPSSAVPITLTTPCEDSTPVDPKGKSSNADSVPPKTPVKAYVPEPPFPNRLRENVESREETKARELGKFTDMLKQINLNMSLLDVFTYCPKYGKMLTELLKRKPNLEAVKIASLTDIPKKLGDPGSFILQCQFTDLISCRALADLGASINLMPHSLFVRLGLGSLTPVVMDIAMADRTVRQPLGLAVDMIIRVGSYLYPVDFVVMEMAEDEKVPLILGRPFLNTARANIDVFHHSITLGAGDTRETIFMSSVMSTPVAESASCCVINTLQHDPTATLSFDDLIAKSTTVVVEGPSELPPQPSPLLLMPLIPESSDPIPKVQQDASTLLIPFEQPIISVDSSLPVTIPITVADVIPPDLTSNSSSSEEDTTIPIDTVDSAITNDIAVPSAEPKRRRRRQRRRRRKPKTPTSTVTPVPEVHLPPSLSGHPPSAPIRIGSIDVPTPPIPIIHDSTTTVPPPAPKRRSRPRRKPKAETLRETPTTDTRPTFASSSAVPTAATTQPWAVGDQVYMFHHVRNNAHAEPRRKWSGPHTIQELHPKRWVTIGTPDGPRRMLRHRLRRVTDDLLVYMDDDGDLAIHEEKIMEKKLDDGTSLTADVPYFDMDLDNLPFDSADESRDAALHPTPE